MIYNNLSRIRGINNCALHAFIAPTISRLKHPATMHLSTKTRASIAIITAFAVGIDAQDDCGQGININGNTTEKIQTSIHHVECGFLAAESAVITDHNKWPPGYDLGKALSNANDILISAFEGCDLCPK